jgi:dipeptidyl aminopeptidase/acylaminoacyl peptidase
MKEHQMRTRRLREQKWLIDKMVETTGIDFMWRLSGSAAGAIGADVADDITGIRSRVKKYADITRELMRVAAKREALAKKAEAEGHPITARDNYFAAAIIYTFAQGPIHEDDDAVYIKNSPHPIERVEIPFEAQTLPGYLHLPPNRPQKVPCVVHVGGMDMFKEMLVPAYNDKFLERGLAVLSFDGPGQNEAVMRKIRCTLDNFSIAGKAAMDFLTRRPEIDATKVAICGISMGSFWVPQIVAYDHRFKAAAVYLVAHETGMKTVFGSACPLFKEKYMWMAGYDDEDKFDKFAEKLTLRRLGDKIQCPVLILAGEDEELSPIQNSYDFYNELTGPRKIIVYGGERHGISNISDLRALMADWISDRLEGKPMQSESIYIDLNGNEIRK